VKQYKVGTMNATRLPTEKQAT